MKKLLSLAVLGLCSTQVHAVTQPTITIGASTLFRADGTTPLLVNSLLVLLADTQGDGFGDLRNGNPGQFSPDADDVVIAKFATNDAVGPGTVIDSLLPSYDDSFVGKKLMLAWYDQLFDASLMGPNYGVAFNTFRTDVEENGSITPNGLGWVVPPNGTWSFNFVTVIPPEIAVFFDNPYPANAGFASQAVNSIPEPASALMLALGLGSLMMTRSRKIA